MKEKIITIKPKGISQKQWSVFILELNLMKRAWKDLWYKLIEEFVNGIDNTDRRIVSFNNRRKRNVQGFNYSRKSYVNLL
jgi:hypothetical protein